jgi:predicted Rossmann fold flavoprotein
MALNYDLIVIGGGAAGLMAAIAAADECEKNHCKLKIAVLEANARVGKKLLATGNGRCNLTNMEASPAHYHGDTKVLAPILKEYSPQKIVDFFESLGLLCKEQDEGRVYPYSSQAAAVLDILRFQLDRFGIETICDFTVTAVKKNQLGFEVTADQNSVTAKRIVLASGGVAYPQLGANGSGFQVLKNLGHSTTKLFPALVQLKTDLRRAKPLKGVRSAAVAVLLADGQPVKSVSGEVQFTENGLSGICIFELSRLVGELGSLKKLEISLDLMPEYTPQQIFSILKQRSESSKSLPSNELLNGCLNKLVGPEVIKAALPRAEKYVCELTASELAAVSKTVKNFSFPITGTLSWKDAQITAGGVPLSEVDEQMQSKFCPGLYLAGELCNIDGDCGGFNLHWAWSSGMIAGRAAAQSMLENLEIQR